MHELSLAMEICRIAEERAGHAAPRLVTVGLEVGDDAGIEAANLEFCLETLLTLPPFRGARAAITRAGGDGLRVSYLEIDDDGPDD
ncbi:MAG TPA: hydrogenase/urease maturation nickel metallochaperone HypA [Gemmatimonadales bacterium]|nr:hydrogenase/urease maturation nickel metallochaperone HypA [Gemmatimonadales bacterium]